MTRNDFQLTCLKSLKDGRLEIAYEVDTTPRTMTVETPSDHAIFRHLSDGAFWCAATGGYLSMEYLEQYFDEPMPTAIGMNTLAYDKTRHAEGFNMKGLGGFYLQTISIDNENGTVQFVYEYKALPWNGKETRKSSKVLFTEDAVLREAAKRKKALFPWHGKLFDYLCEVEDACYEIILSYARADSRKIRQIELFESAKGIQAPAAHG